MPEMHPRLLGRNLKHDEQSKNFPVKTGPVKKVSYRHFGAVLNQGDLHAQGIHVAGDPDALGSCTGNGTAQLLNTRPNHKPFSKLYKELDAIEFYHQGTLIDADPKSWPPDDTGSSGLALAKVVQRLGLITSYDHAFGLDHALGGLAIKPAMTGTLWTQDMFYPDSKGVVAPTGPVAGGHEYVLLGMDPANRMLKFLNSWSKSWGKKGYFYMTFDSYDKLLKMQGDVTFFN